MPDKKSPPQSAERTGTDRSLGAERKKTDAALAETRSATEQSTDAALEMARAHIDKEVDADRADADRSLTPDHDPSEQVQAERQRADDRVAVERQAADQSLQKERVEKKSGEDALFGKERKRTDEKLRHERAHNDTAYEYSTRLLTLEQAAHAQSRATITTRDEFLAVVSHDLRSPLSIIAMCGDELLDACDEHRLTELEADMVETIRRHAASMNRLILDLLDVERMASGHLHIAPAPCNMTALIKEVVHGFQLLANQQGLVLSASLSDQTMSAYIDRERVRQILANLIANAVKFTPKDGSICVSLLQAERDLQVTVADTGPGIPEDKRERIFDRFSQLNRRDRRGVGLGLYISKWIAEAHGGKIWLESDEGKGSKFHFTLPRYHR